MATKTSLCAITILLEVLELIQPDSVTSFTVGAIYIGCLPFPGEVRIAKKGQSLETDLSSKFDHKYCRNVHFRLVESVYALKRC